MKTSRFIVMGLTTVALGLFGAGCAGPDQVAVTNPRQPGPAAGQAVGAGIGAVGGNVAGAVVGVGEGVAAGASAPFNTNTRVIRRWRTETTSDGRTIQVPEEILVDEYGRPISGVKKP
jgi:hypothetical protein